MVADDLMVADDVLISVIRDWNGSHQAFVRLGDLQDIHRFQPSGAPEPLMHAHVLCTSMVTGHIPHDCHHDSMPHRLLVCIPEGYTTAPIYAEIMRRA